MVVLLSQGVHNVDPGGALSRSQPTVLFSSSVDMAICQIRSLHLLKI